MTEPVLRLRGLASGYNGGSVVRGVDLDVQENKVHAILGHNGSGKTTIMETIVGLLRATGGDILLDNASLLKVPTHRRSRKGIGYVPQGRRVFASVTVAEHLAIAHRRGSAWSPKRVFTLLPRLAQRAQHAGAQLSGGEQQMLAIGRALVTGPRVLLLDEPTEGLAPTVVEQIRETVGLLAEQGTTIVITAPQPQWLLSVADQVSVLSGGKIVAEASGADARANAQVVMKHLAPMTTNESTTINEE